MNLFDRLVIGAGFALLSFPVVTFIGHVTDAPSVIRFGMGLVGGIAYAFIGFWAAEKEPTR